MKRRHFIIAGWLVGTIMVVHGCGGGRNLVQDRPVPETGSRYEMVWVDPQIFYTDSLVTLIRADRIDSVLVEVSDSQSGGAARVGFAVSETSCIVVVNLADSHGQVLKPLLVNNLPFGFYQLTLNHPGDIEQVVPLGSYFLKADFCGNRSRSAFVVKRQPGP